MSETTPQYNLPFGRRPYSKDVDEGDPFLLTTTLQKAKAVCISLSKEHLPYGEVGRLTSAFMEDVLRTIHLTEPSFNPHDRTKTPGPND